MTNIADGLFSKIRNLYRRQDAAYEQVSQHPGAVTLPPDILAPSLSRRYADEGKEDEEESLLPPSVMQATNRSSRSRRMSPGWKIAIAGLLLLVAIGVAKLIVGAAKWGNGLDDSSSMPVFNTSLGCSTAPFIYTGLPTLFSSVVQPRLQGHAIDFYGTIPGTITVYQAPAQNETEVQYEMTLRTNDESLLDQVSIDFFDSRIIISTPVIPSSASTSHICARFDVKLYVPWNLQKLHIASHTPTQIVFDEHSTILLDRLYVTLYALSRRNLILPHGNVHASHLALETYDGWIVGETTVVDETVISTQRGGGTVRLKVRPALAPSAKSKVSPSGEGNTRGLRAALLETNTGSGPTEVTFISEEEHRTRSIRAEHRSSMNGDLVLNYEQARFNGLLWLDTNAAQLKGVHKLEEEGDKEEEEREKGDGWTHFAGDKHGGDVVYVSSRGWTGLSI